MRSLIKLAGCFHHSPWISKVLMPARLCYRHSHFHCVGGVDLHPDVSLASKALLDLKNAWPFSILVGLEDRSRMPKLRARLFRFTQICLSLTVLPNIPCKTLAKSRGRTDEIKAILVEGASVLLTHPGAPKSVPKFPWARTSSISVAPCESVR